MLDTFPCTATILALAPSHPGVLDPQLKIKCQLLRGFLALALEREGMFNLLNAETEGRHLNMYMDGIVCSNKQ